MAGPCSGSRIRPLLVLAALWLPPSVAGAQRVGVSLFDPVPNPHGILGVHTARPLQHRAVYGSLVSHYANDELVARRQDQQVHRALQHRFISELGVGVGLYGYVDLALSLPVVWRQTSRDFPAPGDLGRASGLGDLRLIPRVTLLRGREDGGLGLAAVLELTFPTAGPAGLMGDRTVTFTPRLVLDYAFEAPGLVLALNAGYRVRGDASVGTLQVGDEVKLGLGAEQRLGRETGLSLVAEVVSSFGLGGEPREVDVPDVTRYPVELLGAVRWRHRRSGLVLTAGAGAGLTGGYGAPDLRVLLGIAYGWGTGPRPVAAAPAGGQPGSQPGPASQPGEPPPPPPPGAVAALSPVAFDRAAGADPDPDGDGIPSGSDRCPDQPEDVDQFQDRDGCPDPDNDQDGIPDGVDRCPLKKELINGVEDDDGCPDEGGAAKAVLTAKKVEISEKVFFKTGSDQLDPRSHDVLRQVAGVLKANYQVRKVLVEGHSDDRGDKEMNVDLSERRARSVMRFLVREGVAAHRLKGKGFGPRRPVASNRSRAGRARNRRVEFVVLELAGQETRPQEGGR